MCDGLARLDGETLDQFLPGRCISIDIAADGSVWVLVNEGEVRDPYVITPEEVAGAEQRRSGKGTAKALLELNRD